MRHHEGDNRYQACFLPDSLEDQVDQDNPARVIAAFADALDPGLPGFSRVKANAGGRRPYPGVTCSNAVSTAT